MNAGESICQLALQLPDSDDIVSNISVSKEGRVKFKILTSKFRGESKQQSCQNLFGVDQFHIDTVGSLVVKKYMSNFISSLQNISESEYNEKFIMYNHLHFSIEPKKDYLEFTFHISFLHDIVLGDFLSKTESD